MTVGNTTTGTASVTINPRRREYRDGYRCGEADFREGASYRPGSHDTTAEKHFTTGYCDGWETAAIAAETAAGDGRG